MTAEIHCIHLRMPDLCSVSCSRAQAANASGAFISAEAGADVEIMNCRGGECALPLSIPAAMIPLRAASKLQVRAWPICNAFGL